MSTALRMLALGMVGAVALISPLITLASTASAETVPTGKVCGSGAFDTAGIKIAGAWGPDATLYVQNANLLNLTVKVKPAHDPERPVTKTILPTTSETFKLPSPGQLVSAIPESNGVDVSVINSVGIGHWRIYSTVCNTDEYIWNTSVFSGTNVEPVTGSRQATVNVRMGRPVLRATTIAYSTSPGTAVAGQDYTATSGKLTFNPGEQDKVVSIPILADNASEGEEYFTLNLDGNASPTNPSTVVIVNPRVDVRVPILNTPPGPTQPTTPATPPVNKAPVASFSYARVDGTPGKVNLDASTSTDSDGTVTKYEWLTNGAVFATGKAVSWAFGSSRSPSVTLRVIDNVGATATAVKVLSLANRAPTVVRPNPADGTVVGSNRPNLSATVADLDGDSLTFDYRITGYMVDKSSGPVAGGWTVPSYTLDPGQTYTWTVTVRDAYGGIASATRKLSIAMLPTAADVISTASGKGYWQVASDGGVFSYGDAVFYGSVPGIPLKLTNIMGMARTPSGKGYWIVGSDGGVFSFGDAQFAGSLPGQNIRVDNIVGMVPTKTGRGYWLAGADGGVFSFGDAQFYGSMGGKPLNAPVEGISATASGGGYWLVARDGGIFSFGDAPFYGSMGGKPLSYPMVDMDVTPDGGGYWLTAEDGGVFTFGNAPFYGSMAGKPLNGRVTGMSGTPTGKGYWLNACDGGIFTFGDAQFYEANSTYMCRGVNR